MAHKKVKLQRIIIDVKRRVTFMKRLKGLTKKVSEFATLFLMVYGEVEVQATMVWPSVWEATRVLEHFNAMPHLDRYKKMTDLERILNEQVDKLKEQLHKVGHDANESETKLLLIEAINGRRPSLEGLTIEQITSLGWMANAHLKIVNDRLKKLHEEGLIPASVSLSGTEVPTQREGWLMDVARGIGSMGYNRFRGSSGSGTAGYNGDMA
uniref:MADS-box domain-containing protein n=1 Tax=Oryza glumipatula TaxID=40148 RepID=A0A0D9ZJG8_9ORYZ